MKLTRKLLTAIVGVVLITNFTACTNPSSSTSGDAMKSDTKGGEIHIWTFGCINCQRTLPYVVQWHQPYASKGLKIVGIHSPNS